METHFYYHMNRDLTRLYTVAFIPALWSVWNIEMSTDCGDISPPPVFPRYEAWGDSKTSWLAAECGSIVPLACFPPVRG